MICIQTAALLPRIYSTRQVACTALQSSHKAQECTTTPDAIQLHSIWTRPDQLFSLPKIKKKTVNKSAEHKQWKATSTRHFALRYNQIKQKQLQS